MSSLEQSRGCFKPHSMLTFGCFLGSGNAPPCTHSAQRFRDNCARPLQEK